MSCTNITASCSVIYNSQSAVHLPLPSIWISHLRSLQNPKYKIIGMTNGKRCRCSLKYYVASLEYQLKHSTFHCLSSENHSSITSHQISIHYPSFRPRAVCIFSAIDCNLKFETHAVSQTKYCSGLVRDTQNTLCICIDANFSSNVNCKVS